jgi:hypothetical protein
VPYLPSSARWSSIRQYFSCNWSTVSRWVHLDSYHNSWCKDYHRHQIWKAIYEIIDEIREMGFYCSSIIIFITSPLRWSKRELKKVPLLGIWATFLELKRPSSKKTIVLSLIATSQAMWATSLESNHKIYTRRHMERSLRTATRATSIKASSCQMTSSTPQQPNKPMSTPIPSRINKAVRVKLMGSRCRPSPMQESNFDII